MRITRDFNYDRDDLNLINKLKDFNEKRVFTGQAMGELDQAAHIVSLVRVSHKIVVMAFYGEAVTMEIDILDTPHGKMLKTCIDHVDFVPVFLGNEIISMGAQLKQYQNVFFPHQFDKFPFENAKQHWHIHRMSEHHSQPIWMQGFDKKRFILHGIDALGHEKDAIFIVPESIQRIFEFLLCRGRLEQGKMLGLIFDELISFKDADIVEGRPTISVDDKYLYPHKYRK